MDNTIIEDINNNLSDIVSDSNTQDIISNYDIQNISFDTIYQDILSSIKDAFNFPLNLTVLLIVCILITSIIQSFN